MVNCGDFVQTLQEHKIEFFSGVPDSLLKDFCSYIADHAKPAHHIIAANEGGAIALAVGYHLATGKIGAVYMQNSGQGNSINPLVSLADPEVYSIPMLLFIGWRGEPGIHDEPQHVKQGRITLDLLKVLGIPFEILATDLNLAKESLQRAVQYMQEKQAPFAFVVKKNTFDSYQLQKKSAGSTLELSREQAIGLTVAHLDAGDAVVTTTGMTSRELFEYRASHGQDHGHDFLTVGSMGHASQIALSIALAQPQKTVYCIDGDGAVIMHAGALAIIGDQAPKNFKHIIINNGAHDSVGGQPTAGFHIDFSALAKACGYTLSLLAQTKAEVETQLGLLTSSSGPALLEIRVHPGARQDLGRPTSTPTENKKMFMQFLK